MTEHNGPVSIVGGDFYGLVTYDPRQPTVETPTGQSVLLSRYVVAMLSLYFWLSYIAEGFWAFHKLPNHSICEPEDRRYDISGNLPYAGQRDFLSQF
ncbi:hypothetical protein M514_02043 [Trichuris suis]|uniref:Uncharacterized protein n=1 Tax=Trichuris suis TaxID=68888 RepID=A0A085MIW2_9BILA|nr:hypothetical protein M513_02043 [Trichuris suis]KFD63605.1 hypothetical protein M514_02043 [Trichuris suis]